MRREYRIHPWEVARYTVAELEALAEDLKERDRLAREAVE